MHAPHPVHSPDKTSTHGSHTCCGGGHSATGSRGQVHGLVLSSWNQVLRLLGVLILNVGYGTVEYLGSHHTHSWALMSDAGHMLADASSVLLALLAALLSLWVQRVKAYQTAWWIERLVATLNACGLTLVAITLGITAIQRVMMPPEVQGDLLLWIAAGGLLVNGLAVWLFHGDHQHNLNIRGAYLHMLSDLMGSVAALLSAVFILVLHWHWMDAVMALAVSGLVCIAALQFWKSVRAQWTHPPTLEQFEHPLLAKSPPPALPLPETTTVPDPPT
jgi:cation diffusion facilitator family transporter